MKMNQWTLGLAAVGLVSLPGVVAAEEASQHLLTALSSTTISGFVDTSANWNFGTGNANVPAIPFIPAGRADGFNLNYVQVTIQKPLDAQDNWAAGYRVDLGYGDDLPLFGTTAGNTGIKQAYVALRAPVGNGINFKVGVFDSIIGYETFERVNNPHYSHSYGYLLEPTSHTGVLASYQITELVGVSAGVANSIAPLINNRTYLGTGLGVGHAESYKTTMGSLTLKAPDSWGFLAGSALYGGIINGVGSAALTTAHQNYYAGATLNTPWTAVKVGFAYDYAGNNGVGAKVAGTHAYTIGGYVSVKATDKLTFLARGEHYKDSQGLGAGLPSRVVAGTATIQYDLWANVLSRLEFRWDHQADGTGRYYGSNAAGAPDRRNALMLAANIIYKF
ncbi:MAG: outer membrane beta-barrel protein [Verrucomicrobia bacterium]|nr:outer membrane beta-barrel protein [Verrucomicrobiota bacterium]MBI3870951.1 outer membrane beta-barrel protein [Verrucomicrobiota bacterium]